MNNLPKLQALCGGRFDALLLTGGANRFYASGVKTSAGMVFVTGKNAVFLTDFRYAETARERRDGFEVRVVTRERETYEEVVRSLISENGVRRLGFEENVWTVGGHRKWAEAIDVEWVRARDAVAEVRAVKEDWELERMKKAQRITERVYETVLGMIRPGMTERELAAELVYHMLKNGASGTAFDPIVVSGPNASLPHGEPGDRPLRAGDFVTMDFGCVYGGYCSDMTRTVAIGYADGEMRKVYDIVLDAQAAGMGAARAGVPGRRIHEAAARVIADAGYGAFFGHGFGHGIGIEVHEDYGAHPKEERALPAGAVISAEPGIYLPGRFGVRIEDCVVLRDGGYENLTAADKKLWIIGESSTVWALRFVP